MNAPTMSVVILTPDRFGTIARTIEHLKAQNVCDRLEIVIAARSASELEIDAAALRAFHSFKVIEIGPVTSTARARAEGVRQALAPIVAFAEDHSYPAPGWAEALIARHEEQLAAVGPVIANANPHTLISWANLLIEYAEWLEPSTSGEREHLPGHNSSYKRAVLLQFGDRLEAMLDAESTLHWELRRLGYRLYLEPKARTLHQNFSTAMPCAILRFNGGRLFASARSRAWPWWRRLMFGLAAPLIPLVRLVRIVRELFKPGRPRQLLPQLLPVILLGLIFDGAGEMIGYAFGAGGAMAQLSDMEFHRERYLTRSDQIEATTEPQPSEGLFAR